MISKAKKIIKNSWKREFNAWLKKINKLRMIESEKFKTGERINKEIGIRCWGQINQHFASTFFELMKEVKKDNIELYNKYIEETNKILFLWDFNTEYFSDKCKDEYH